MEYLEGNTSHPSAQDVYQAVSEKLTTISLTTIYNNLMRMAEQGLIQELTIPGKSGKRFDPDTTPHDHLICTSCDKIIDVPSSRIQSISPKHLHGFDIQRTVSHIFGLCPRCQEKPETN
jgi:Fur family peroxide stress response transcriptional regulator